MAFEPFLNKSQSDALYGGQGVVLAHAGHDAIGASWETNDGNMRAVKVSFAQDTFVGGIEVYLRAYAIATDELIVALFDDLAGVPRHLLQLSTATRVIVASDNVNVMDPRWLGAPIGRLVPAGDYWIGAKSGNTAFQYAYDAGGSDVNIIYSWPCMGDVPPFAGGAYAPVAKTYSIRCSTLS